ncbi:MAG: ATP-binding protein [Clostridia bacterium]|nr:ATP-binding protein [Clostridia bacterium]
MIQNVDDCDYEKPEFCCLDINFDFNQNQIVLTYNETGFTPANVFAITGIAEAAKNITSTKNEIGEKGIGFKSVFGVAEKVWIRSGFFSFELSKKSFTIPVYAA